MLTINTSGHVYQYPGATRSTSKVHINNTYIKYTSVDVASLLICQVSGAVPLPVTAPLIIEALSLGFGFNFGFLHWSGNCFAILEVSLLALALLELVVLPSTLDVPS